jgi:hypothetical protein
MSNFSTIDLAHDIIEMWNRGEAVILENSEGKPIFNLSELEMSPNYLVSEEGYRKTHYYLLRNNIPGKTPVYTLHYLPTNMQPFL